MIKDFSISFSSVIIVQDFETVSFYVLFVYNPTFSPGGGGGGAEMYFEGQLPNF